MDMSALVVIFAIAVLLFLILKIRWEQYLDQQTHQNRQLDDRENRP